MTALRTLSWFLLTVPLAGSVACGLVEQDDAAGSGGSSLNDDGATGGVSTGDAGTGGTTSSGGACSTADVRLFPCPDPCTALAQLSCELPSQHTIVNLRGDERSPIIGYAVDGLYLECLYREGVLVGATFDYDEPGGDCEGYSRTLTWGEMPYQEEAATFPPEPCENVGVGGNPSEPRSSQCYSARWNQCGDCCPASPPDCTGQPDLTHECTTGQCDCRCLGGEWTCDCP